jgi:hypothetical protein
MSVRRVRAFVVVMFAGCWHAMPAPSGGHELAPAAPPVPALGSSPCATLATHEMSTADAPRVPPPPHGGRIHDPAFSGLVAGRFVVVFAVPTVSAYVYDLRADRWSHFDGASGPASAAWIRAFAAGDHVVLAWSTDDPEQLLELAAVDVVRAEVRAMPLAGAPPRFNGVVDAVGGALVVWPGPGRGYSMTPGIDYAQGSKFDFTTWAWQPLPARGAPSPRTAASYVVAGHRVFVWGGEAGKRALRDGAVLDTVRATWTPVDAASAPPARRAAPAFAWRDRVLVWGGELPYDGSPHDLHDAWIYDLDRGTWRATTGTPPQIPSTAAGHETRGTGRFAAIVPDATADLGAGGVLDFATERWDPLPDLPANARPPAAGRPRWFVQLGERAVGWVGQQGGPPPLVVLDLADRTWCLPDVHGSAVLATGLQSLFWDGTTVGVWGALDAGPAPHCPPGAPCARSEPHWTGTPIGSVLSW